MTNTSFAPLRTVAIIAMVAILTTLSCLMWVLPATGDAVVAAVAAAAWSVALDYRNQRTETR